MTVATVVTAVVVPCLFWRLMLVKVKEPLQQEHHDETEHNRKRHSIKRSVQRTVRETFRPACARLNGEDDRVRKQVKKPHRKHGARDETQGKLQAPVTEFQLRSNSTARE